MKIVKDGDGKPLRSFQEDLRDLITWHGLDKKLKMPAFVMANFIDGCMFSYLNNVTEQEQKECEETDNGNYGQ